MRARFLFRALLIPLLAVCRLTGSTAPTPEHPGSLLSVDCTHDDRVLHLVGVEDEALLVGDDSSAARPPPAHASWTVRGDIRAHAALLHWSPEYRLRRDPRRSDGQLRADVALMRRIDIAPQASEISDRTLADWSKTIGRDRDPFTAAWPGDSDQPGAVIALWIVDGRAVQTQIQPVPQVGNSREYRLEFTFSLNAAEARGQPALMLWRNGAFVSPHPYSTHAATQEAFRAILFDDRAALSAALEHGARRYETTPNGRASLTHYAAECDASACLSLLLADRAKSIAEAERGNSSPLAWAAQNGRLESVKLLLDVYASNKRTRTLPAAALNAAIASGHLEVVRHLIPHAVKTRDWPDFAPIARHLLMTAGYPDIGELIASEATASNLQSDAVESRRSAETLLVTHAAQGHLPMVEHLLSTLHVSPEAAPDGSSALMRAVHAGESEVVRVLIEAGANPNRADSQGITPLMVASQRNDPELVQRLLAAGARPNSANSTGMTALHFAASSDAPAVVSMLLDAGADLQICSIRDITPLDLALLTESTRAVIPLMERGACIGLGAPYSRDLLLAAIVQDIDSPLATALEQGWPPGSTFAGTWPALRVAELLGAERCAARLRAAGAIDAPLPFPVVDLSALDAPLLIEEPPSPKEPRPAEAHFPAALVRVRVLVDTHGRVLFPNVVDCPDPALVPAALNAVQSAHFAAPRHAGKPVATFTTIDVAFPASRDRVFQEEEVTRRAFAMSQPRPYAPESARKLKGKADVVMSYVVNRFGHVEQVEILESPDNDCTHAARLALAQWAFVPAEIRGVPIAVQKMHTFDFHQAR